MTTLERMDFDDTALVLPELEDVPEDDEAEPLDAGCPDDPALDAEQ